VLLRVYRLPATAAPTISAVADAAPVACVLSHVHLIGSCSATAHARDAALLVLIVLLAARAVAEKFLLVYGSAGVLTLLKLAVAPAPTVLPGSSAMPSGPRAYVILRARGSAYHSLSAI
jgi:hypothetical protein